MVRQMNQEGFANCSNIGECEAACPKEIRLEVIAQSNADYIKAAFTERPETAAGGAGCARPPGGFFAAAAMLQLDIYGSFWCIVVHRPKGSTVTINERAVASRFL